jgi:hypothetical protein
MSCANGLLKIIPHINCTVQSQEIWQRKPTFAGFSLHSEASLNYFSLVSLYMTCLRTLGSYFFVSIFSGAVRLFLVAV